MAKNTKIFIDIFAYIFLSFISYFILYHLYLINYIAKFANFLSDTFLFIVITIPRFDVAFKYIEAIGDSDRISLIIISLIWMMILLFVGFVIFNKKNMIITKENYYNDSNLKGFLIILLFVTTHILLLLLYFIYMFFISFFPFSGEKFYLNLGDSGFNLALEMTIHQLFLFIIFAKPTRYQGFAAQNIRFPGKL